MPLRSETIRGINLATMQALSFQEAVFTTKQSHFARLDQGDWFTRADLECPENVIILITRQGRDLYIVLPYPLDEQFL
jgi:hypothetical protein